MYANTDTYSYTVKESMDKIKTNIIKNKLNLIFKLDNEDVIVNEFDTLKNEYRIVSEKDKLIKMYNDKLNKVNWSEYEEFYDAEKELEENAENKSESKGEVKQISEEKRKRDLNKLTIEKDKLIKIVDRKIDEDIRQFNNFLKEYRDDKVKNKDKLRTALSLYIENIKPHTSKLFNLKYEEFIIEENNIGGGGFGKKPEVEYVFKLKKNPLRIIH